MQSPFSITSLQGSLGNQAVVNMAAAVGRLLSFSKNAKVLVSPLKLSAVPVHRYSVEVSSTGEAITHTGQVSLQVVVFASVASVLLDGQTLA